jgi:hypothetical protein
MTGRAAGYCAGYDAPGFANPRFGMGRGLGRGRGFGWRRMWRLAPAAPATPVYREPTREQELQMLEEEQKVLKEEMAEIEKRVKELKKK